MKKILMLVMMLGLIHDNTNAQARKAGIKSFNNNYSVCSNLSGYYVCSSDQLRAQNQRNQASTEPVETHTQVVNMQSTVVLSDGPDYSSGTSYRYHNFIIGGDNMDNPANGLPSQQYDGPAKNDERNKNYNQTQMHLPPSNGNSSNR